MAARAALAVNRIDSKKYFEFHVALMNSSGKFDDASLAAIARTVGVDADKMKMEMEKPEITAMLDKTREIADDVGIRGTPALLVGNQLYPGAIPYEDIKRIVTTARNSGGSKAADVKAPPKTMTAPPPPKDATPPKEEE
jgi:protein-disulfide isomerase